VERHVLDIETGAERLHYEKSWCFFVDTPKQATLAGTRVHGGIHDPNHRQISTHAIQRLRDDQLLPGGYQGHANPTCLRHLSRPCTCCIDNDRAFNDAFRGGHPGSPAGTYVDGEHVRLRQQGCTLSRRCSGEADRNLRWGEISVITDPHRRYDACRLQEWIEATCLLRRNQLDIKAHTAPALKVVLDNLRVLRSTCDLQAARMNPIERLPGFFRERFNLATCGLDEDSHKLAFASAAHHARSAERGLRSDIMLVDQDDAETFAFAQVICCGRAEAAGTNDNNIGLANHD